MKPPVYNPAWSDQVKNLYQHDMEQYWDPSLSRHQWNQYRATLDRYLAQADTAAPLEVLDVGCAQATLALLLAERGHSVTAVDIRQESLDYARSRYEHGNIKFVQGNVLEMELEQRFDLIFANQIIEHLVYPMELVEGLKALLAPHGRLLVSTPNWAYMMSSQPSFSDLGDPKQWEDKQFTADGDGHFFAYTEQELRDIFTRAGLRKIETTLFETPFTSGHMKFRYLHKVLPYSLLRWLDKALLAIPGLNKKVSHQLMIVGSK